MKVKIQAYMRVHLISVQYVSFVNNGIYGPMQFSICIFDHICQH